MDDCNEKSIYPHEERCRSTDSCESALNGIKSTHPAFSSSSSLDPEPVLVGRSSSGTTFELLLLPSIVVSANLFVCAMFSIILPPAVKSDILCFRAARCFFALVRSA